MRVSWDRVVRLLSSTNSRWRRAMSSNCSEALPRRLGRTAECSRERIVCIRECYLRAPRIGRFFAPDGILRRDSRRNKWKGKVFRDDLSRLRTGNAPQNMAAVRQITLIMMIIANDKASIKVRRKKAAWSPKYLETVIRYGIWGRSSHSTARSGQCP